MRTNKELLEHIIANEKRLEAKIDKIESALLGDEYEQRLGFLKQVSYNVSKLDQHEEQLTILNKKINKKITWKGIAASGGSGVATGYSITHWSSFMEWINKILNG